MKTFIALIAFTNPAWAECNPDQDTFMACSFPNGKYVEVCMNDEYVRYRYGRLGQSPELHLALSYGEGAEFVPWHGAGSNIWESVRLTNNGVVYEVYGGYSRGTSTEDDGVIEVSPTFGGIYIEDLMGDQIAHLVCITGTVEYLY